MNQKTKLLEAIKDTFTSEIVQPLTHELDEHIPIYGYNNQIIGYWNIRCYEELRKMLQKPEPSNR